jgi:hypothetical protein
MALAQAVPPLTNAYQSAIKSDDAVTAHASPRRRHLAQSAVKWPRRRSRAGATSGARLRRRDGLLSTRFAKCVDRQSGASSLLATLPESHLLSEFGAFCE